MLHPSVTAQTQFAASAGQRIFITGASGNLGGELARQLAGTGVSMSLWGRNQPRLEATARDCREAGATVSTRSIDLDDAATAVSALAAEDEAEPFGIAILVAGQGDTLPAGQAVEDAAQIIRLGLTNFIAPAALAAELGERMAARRGGQIVFIGSAAAVHSLPFAAGYASSKAGLARYADALRLALSQYGVRITLVAPGFFAAKAGTQPSYARPGEVPAAVIAERIIRAMQTGKAELITPWRFALLGWISRLMPRPLRDRVLLSLPFK